MINTYLESRFFFVLFFNYGAGFDCIIKCNAKFLSLDFVCKLKVYMDCVEILHIFT